MVSDTRSGRKIRSEMEDQSLKNNRNFGNNTAVDSLGEADILGEGRSARDTSAASGHPAPSPQSEHKYKLIDKKTLPSTSFLNQKSERLEKDSTPSPLRRSDRGKRDLPLSQSAKKHSSSEETSEKENNSMQVSMEDTVEQESICGKRKTMTAHCFKAIFKKQKVIPVFSDIASEIIPSPECETYIKPENSTTRINSNSPEKVFCSLGANVDENLSSPSPCKDKSDHGAAVTLDLADQSDCGNKEPHSDHHQKDGCENMCANNSGEIKCNEGKHSKSSSRLIVEGSTSRFPEYWLPAQLSNHQLEQYCAALLSKDILLRSKKDPTGALRDLVYTVKKCCDHPFLDDLSVQDRMFAEQCSREEILDFGIKASGKLQLLDLMLMDFKTRGLKVLILFQANYDMMLLRGSRQTSNGDILDDYLRQRFGETSFERVEGLLLPPKKQATINKFNKNETGQFVFLLEKSACSPTIKLLSVDIIVIYNSDWNPLKDLQSLQKISFDLKVEQIKVFRLYSSCTIEERALSLAKKNINLEYLMQTPSRATCDSLLIWGASHLFSKLDAYHADLTSTSNDSSGQLYLSEVMMELRSILSASCENSDYTPMISKIKLDNGRYSANIPLLGEAKVRLKEGEDPGVFWGNLLHNRKIPEWKHLSKPAPRNRKRVQYSEETPGKPGKSGKSGTGLDVGKKCRIKVNENIDQASVHVGFGGHRMTRVAGPDGGPSTTISYIQLQSLQLDGIASNNATNCISDHKSLVAEVALESAERVALSIEQKSLHNSLQGELTKLCQILKLQEDVGHTATKFLEYAIKNHRISSDSPAILQAFQISLCWIAASVTNKKVDKKGSLLLAKQLLDYQCTDEQALSVYSKIQSWKNNIESGLLAEESISRGPSNVDEEVSKLASCKTPVKKEVEEQWANEKHATGQQKEALRDKGASSENDSKIKQIQKMCDKRIKKLKEEHQEKRKEFRKTWEEKKLKMENELKLESAIIRSLHCQVSVRNDKLKLLNDNYAKKQEVYSLQNKMELESLEAQLDAAMDEMKRKNSLYLAKLNACSTEERAFHGTRLLNSQSEEDAGCSQFATYNKVDNTDVLPSNASVTPANVGCDDPTQSPSCLVTAYHQDEAVAVSSQSSSPNVVEKLNHFKQSSDTGEIASEEQVCIETLPVELNKEVPTDIPENVPLENTSNVHPQEFNNASYNKQITVVDTVTDPVVSERGALDESITVGLLSTGQVLEHSETAASPNQFGLLQLQVPQADQHSAELLVPNTLVDENQCTSLNKVPASEQDDTVAAVLSNFKLQDEEALPLENLTSFQTANSELIDTVNPVQSVMEEEDQDVPPVEDQSSLQTASSEPLDTISPVQSVMEHQDQDALPLDNQSTLQTARLEHIVTENPERSVVEQQDQDAPPLENLTTLRTTNSELVDTVNMLQSVVEQQDQEAPPLESQSTLGLIDTGISVQSNIEAPANGNYEQQMDCGLIEVPTVEIEHPNSHQRSSSLHAAEAAETVVFSHEPVIPNQVVMQLGNDANHLPGSSALIRPTYQNHAASGNLAPALYTEPLKSELDRISIEKERLEKSHEDTASLLKSDCEKEIQESVAQIRSKYEVQLQDKEAELILKKKELEKNQKIVLMNKILAEVFRSKVLDIRPTGPPGMQQGAPSSYLHHPLRPPSMRPFVGASSNHVSHRQQIASPTQAQSIQQPSPSYSMRHSPVSVQNITAPSPRPSPVVVQNVRVPPPVQSVYNQAALFSGISSSRPPVISGITPTRNPSSISGGIQVQVRSRAPHLLPRPSTAAASSPVAPPHLRPIRTAVTSSLPIGMPLQPNPPLSRHELQMSRDDWRNGVRNHASGLQDNCSSFRSLDPGDLAKLGSNIIQDNPTMTSSSKDVVCLSDDE